MNARTGEWIFTLCWTVREKFNCLFVCIKYTPLSFYDMWWRMYVCHIVTASSPRSNHIFVTLRTFRMCNQVNQFNCCFVHWILWCCNCSICYTQSRQATAILFNILLSHTSQSLHLINLLDFILIDSVLCWFLLLVTLNSISLWFNRSGFGAWGEKGMCP